METEEKASAQNKCKKRPKWYALIPVTVGIALLLLGYYLDARVFKVLGMILAAFVLLLLS